MRTAAERLQTLLTVLPRFAMSPRQSLSQLSDEYGVPRAELAADLAALAERSDESSEFEYGALVRIEGDTVEVTADHFLRPMRLTMAELCALELGLGMLRHESDAGAAAQIEWLLSKLRRVIVELPQQDVHRSLRRGELADGSSSDVRRLMREALRTDARVEILYQSARDAVPSPRVVHPYGLVFSTGSSYLVGWCERSGEQRVFRTDRIIRATLTGDTFTAPADYRVEDVLVNGRPWIGGGTTTELVVRYSPVIARWIVERDGGPLEEDGAAIRTMPLVDREWAIRHVLEHAPEAMILEPAELRPEVAARLESMLAESPTSLT